MPERGWFITLEGGEGTGKTTQSNLLAESFLRAGFPAVAMRSPGNTAVAEKLRAILKTKEPGEDLLPETELLLFGACHAQMCRYSLQPALESGTTVICDRFFDSTTVYQGYARKLPLETVARINAFACRGTVPDLTILLDMDPALGLKRAEARSGGKIDASDRFDSESFEFHRSVRDSFLKLASLEPGRFRIVSAAGSISETAAAVKETINHEYGLELV